MVLKEVKWLETSVERDKKKFVKYGMVTQDTATARRRGVVVVVVVSLSC